MRAGWGLHRAALPCKPGSSMAVRAAAVCVERQRRMVVIEACAGVVLDK
jgi:hypothetical protein